MPGTSRAHGATAERVVHFFFSRDTQPQRNKQVLHAPTAITVLQFHKILLQLGMHGMRFFKPDTEKFLLFKTDTKYFIINFYI